MGYFTQTTALACLFCCVWVTGLDPALVSPCPNHFIYRFQDLRKNTWYGSIFITSDSDSYVIQNIRILLDSEAEALKIYDHKNPQVTVDTLDNTEFLVEGLDIKVRKTNTFQLTIAVTYKREHIPKLTAYRVNEFTVCSKTATVGAPGINIPTPATTTYSPPSAGTGSGPWTSRPSWLSPQPAPVPTPLAEGSCGTRLQAATPLIVGGIESPPGSWPWHAALFSLSGSATQYRCGASLVTPRHLVTAAHCVCLHQRSQQPLDARRLLLVLGRLGLNDWGDRDSQSVRAGEVHVYPGYNSSNYRNDIAVIRLEEPVKITPYVRPICLWGESSDIKLLLHKKGTVVGWGYTATGKTSETLQHAEIPVIDHFDCLGKKHEFYSQYLSPKSFCAGAIATKGSKVHQACNGDSGGGLAFPKAGTDVWQLRGVVSLAPYDRDADRCDVTLYMVFTDIAYFLDWIREHTRDV